MIEAVRNSVVAKGITINGLPFVAEDDDTGGPYGYLVARPTIDLQRYFQESVIGGPGSFVMPVTDSSGFADSIRRKLIIEIARAD
jgi:hypothetical protein